MRVLLQKRPTRPARWDERNGAATDPALRRRARSHAAFREGQGRGAGRLPRCAPLRRHTHLCPLSGPHPSIETFAIWPKWLWQRPPAGSRRPRRAGDSSRLGQPDEIRCNQTAELGRSARACGSGLRFDKVRVARERARAWAWRARLPIHGRRRRPTSLARVPTWAVSERRTRLRPSRGFCRTTWC